jgi:hypothetical protein
MSLFFQKLNISDPDWNLDAINIPSPAELKFEKHFRNVDEIVPDDFLYKLKTVNLVPEYARIFVWPRNFFSQWHIDGDIHLPRYSCMNWVLKGSGVIQFNGNIKLTESQTMWRAEGKLSSSDDDYESETSGHGYAINSGYCHRVATKEDGRTTISLSYDRRDVQFEIMIEKLKQVNLI